MVELDRYGGYFCTKCNSSPADWCNTCGDLECNACRGRCVSTKKKGKGGNKVEGKAVPENNWALAYMDQLGDLPPMYHLTFETKEKWETAKLAVNAYDKMVEALEAAKFAMTFNSKTDRETYYLVKDALKLAKA